MSKIDDGGKFNPYVLGEKVSGISRRDWLAGLAMQGMLANPSIGNLSATHIPSDAYIYADAMIAKSKES